jgi:hypothetical protein
MSALHPFNCIRGSLVRLVEFGAWENRKATRRMIRIALEYPSVCTRMRNGVVIIVSTADA